jgi:hypothetical protein
MRNLAVLLLLGLAPGAWADESKKPETKNHQVPYRLTTTNHVLVRAKINGKGPYNFILDTGAPALFVSTGVSRKLGVSADGQGWGTFDRLEIEGGVVLTKARGRVEDPFQLEGMNTLGLAGAELHGIIGYTVLARYRLEFDFTKHKMGWTELDYKPQGPQGLGAQATSGLDAMSTVIKLLGAFLGKRPEQEIALRGFLGIALEDTADGVAVSAALADGPAALAGLQAGDRITHFQGKEVSSTAELQRRVAGLGADETARLRVLRGDATHTINIKAGKGI